MYLIEILLIDIILIPSWNMVSCNGTYIEWIAKYFGECVNTPRQKASFALGIGSTCSGIYMTVPQVFLNFKLHSAEGLSFGFILLMFAGDFCNGLGAFLSGGLMTQVISACWFVLIDIICLSQYIYYTWIGPRCQKSRVQAARDPIPNLMVVPLLVAPTYSSSPYQPPQLYGTILGWFSSCSYIGSRLPQIYYNFQRRKTEGLSPQIFISACIQNICYSGSIFLWDTSWHNIWAEFPWLVGSLGVMGFDFLVLGQFLYFGAQSAKDKETDATMLESQVGQNADER
jgi:uncharacterized protein with PQ loop repeat